MNKIKYTIQILAIMLTAVSCGENREEEYRPRTDTNKWIVEKMSDVYLWNTSMKTSDKTNAVPEIFFPTVLTSNGNGGRSDSYSFIDTEGNTNRLSISGESYGFEYYTENVEGKAIAARVLMVYKDSPAFRSGLKRGDRITAVDGIKLTQDNISSLEKGGSRKLQLSTYRIDNSATETNGKPQYIWVPTDTIDLQASEVTACSPLYFDSIYNIEGKNIGYVMINNTTPNSTGYEYAQQLSDAIGKISACEEIIIDLRYNSSCNMNLISELASMLYGKSSASDILLTKRFNENHSDRDSIICFGNKYPANRLNKEKMHFIISDKTAMEAEAMIRSLSEKMEIITAGTSSMGKNIIQEAYVCPTYPQYVIYPVVACYAANAEETNNFSPVTAKIQITEKVDTVETFKAIGDTAEIMLKATIEKILHPDTETEPEQ